MELHYDRMGHGPRILLAFHGVGQTGHACFLPFATHLGHYYTLYAFDLFHHGKSLVEEEDFSDQQVVTKELWRHLMQDFLTKNGIERFDVAGFSIGGRFALATAEAFPDRLNRLLLIAPDGVVEHPLYRVATRYAPTRWLYRKIIHHPQGLLALAEVVQKAGLLPESLVRFVRHMLATPQGRRVIYRSWVSFRRLSFSMATLYALLKARRVEVWLFVGEYDPLLPPRKLKILSDRLPAEHFVVLKTGHTRLVEKVSVYLKEVFK